MRTLGIEAFESAYVNLAALVIQEVLERPRKTLGFHTPSEVFRECVASIN